MADKPKSRQEEKSDKKNSEDEGNSEEEDPHATGVPGPGAVGGIQLSDEKDKEVRRKRKMPALKGGGKVGGTWRFNVQRIDENQLLRHALLRTAVRIKNGCVENAIEHYDALRCKFRDIGVHNAADYAMAKTLSPLGINAQFGLYDIPKLRISTLVFIDEEIIIAQEIPREGYTNDTIKEVCKIDTHEYHEILNRTGNKALQTLCLKVATLQQKSFKTKWTNRVMEKLTKAKILAIYQLKYVIDTGTLNRRLTMNGDSGLHPTTQKGFMKIINENKETTEDAVTAEETGKPPITHTRLGANKIMDKKDRPDSWCAPANTTSPMKVYFGDTKSGNVNRLKIEQRPLRHHMRSGAEFKKTPLCIPYAIGMHCHAGRQCENNHRTRKLCIDVNKQRKTVFELDAIFTNIYTNNEKQNKNSDK